MSPTEQERQETVVAYTTAAVVMKAWDDMIIPEAPEDFGNDKTTYDYVNKLVEVIRETAADANKNEAMSQNLAAANVRQTEIISKLRTEIARLKIALMQKSLGTEPA